MVSLSTRQLSKRQIGLALLLLAASLLAVMTTPWRAQSQGSNQVTTVSAASYAPVVAPESIAATFGARLATRAEGALVPLPTSIAGTTVKVNGELARLFYVSPGQVNYIIPSGTANGLASVVVTSGDG